MSQYLVANSACGDHAGEWERGLASTSDALALREGAPRARDPPGRVLSPLPSPSPPRQCFLKPWWTKSGARSAARASRSTCARRRRCSRGPSAACTSCSPTSWASQSAPGVPVAHHSPDCLACIVVRRRSPPPSLSSAFDRCLLSCAAASPPVASFAPIPRRLGSRITPEALCGMLHSLFSDFDEICEQHGVYKIETIVRGTPVGAPPRPSQRDRRELSHAERASFRLTRCFSLSSFLLRSRRVTRIWPRRAASPTRRLRRGTTPSASPASRSRCRPCAKRAPRPLARPLGCLPYCCTAGTSTPLGIFPRRSSILIAWLKGPLKAARPPLPRPRPPQLPGARRHVPADAHRASIRASHRGRGGRLHAAVRCLCAVCAWVPQ